MSGLFFKVGLDFVTHPKFHDAESLEPGAVAVWAWLVGYTRLHELSGRVPKTMARKQCFHLGDKFDRCVHALATSGLVRILELDIEVLKYAEHNETKVAIDKRRALDRRRKRDARVQAESKRIPENVRNQNTVCVTDSDSVSVRESAERDGDDAPAAPTIIGETASAAKYREAYTRAIAAGKRSTYAFQFEQAGYLHQAIQAHARSQRPERFGKALQKEELIVWIEFEANAFASWLAQKPESITYYSSFGPKGFLKYLNEDTAVLSQRAS